MSEQVMEIGQLDLLARAESIKSSLTRARMPITLVTAFIVLLAVISGASFKETIATRALAIIAVAAVFMLWLRSRYAPYALALLFSAIVMGAWTFDDPDYHTVLGSTTRVMISAIVLFVAYRWWTNAMAFDAAHSKQLETECSQVQEWMKILKSSTKTDQVIEFSVRSFWSGYWTYRLLNTGTCWVIAKFKVRNVRRLLGCRVHRLDAVRATYRAGEKLLVKVGDESIQNVEISTDMRDRLLHFISVA
jgi:hypothetical protein